MTDTAQAAVVNCQRGQTVTLAGVEYRVAFVWRGREWQEPGEVKIDLVAPDGSHRQLRVGP